MVNSQEEFDADCLKNVHINYQSVCKHVDDLLQTRSLSGKWEAAWLLKAITFIDLTTLAGDDTEVNVSRLCYKATHPLSTMIEKELGISENYKLLTTGAVCVYPARVPDAVKLIQKLGFDLPIAAVATGFPSGQYGLKSRLIEIEQAVKDGAREIDIVINRRHALAHNWKGLFDELVLMRKSCGSAELKAILAVGELGTLTNVYYASYVAMMAGAHFIKTSTGKESVNATLPVGVVMCRAIRDYYRKTGRKVGLKPAGGLRSGRDALNWMILIKEELGNEWLNPHLFRIGASSLLTDIEEQLFQYAFGRQPASYEISKA